ncbi:hypothetical protein VNO80_30112 [Phaseolus coccineus]|uniref:Cellulose synthase-like protein E1 n=1 Tax=Phaseolus coccineus TaxID=3886 RepID=A0AAN9LCL5_PHACN
MTEEKCAPLFETKRAKGRLFYKVFSLSLFVGICFIWVFRVSHIPRESEDGKWGWIGLLCAELCRETECAASDITFYALLEASIFAKQWLPFCRKFKVDPTSPAAYFKTIASSTHPNARAQEFVTIKKLYQDMESRIENAAKMGRVPEEILLDGKDSSVKDVDGNVMPILVYLAREKRPHVAHNFKAGAMNSLIRVSSMISNGDIILNIDCDMYSNNSQSLRDALCFFMNEDKGHEIAFVQSPQCFENITKNDLYAGSLRVIYEMDFHGLDSLGGPLYIGTGCFHRREILCGRKFNDQIKKEASLNELEEKSKAIASCTFEKNTLWGKEVTFFLIVPISSSCYCDSDCMGLQYGCSLEDVRTGLSIKCRGWKSVNYNPQRKAFLGVAPNTLPQTLVQHKRWSEGCFQILLSKHSPAWCAYGFISPGLQMAYCYYNPWVFLSWPTLYYCIIPSLYLLKGIPLFPQMSSPWFIPFAYVMLGDSFYCLMEFLWSGGTVKGWWNDLRLWLYKRTTSYLFAFVDTIFKFFGFSESTFIVSAKVAEEKVSQRYEKEIMEFGNSSPMLTLLATLALLNLFCLLGMLLKQVFINEEGLRIFDTIALQILLSGVLVLINVPVYLGLFLRKDKGRLPISVAAKSTALALTACALFISITLRCFIFSVLV